MAAVVIEPDDGYMTVEVRQPADAGGGSAAVQLDLFEAVNVYTAVYAEHADPVPRAEAWIRWLVGKGLPRLSHGAAYALAAKIHGAVDEYVKKNPGLSWESRESPAFSGSTSPDCPPDESSSFAST